MMNETFVIFGTEHGNPLGLARSLGENGIRPIGIILRAENRIASMSRYWKKCYLVDSVEEGFSLLLQNDTQGDKKAFLFSGGKQECSLSWICKRAPPSPAMPS